MIPGTLKARFLAKMRRVRLRKLAQMRRERWRKLAEAPLVCPQCELPIETDKEPGCARCTCAGEEIASVVNLIHEQLVEREQAQLELEGLPRRQPWVDWDDTDIEHEIAPWVDHDN